MNTKLKPGIEHIIVFMVGTGKGPTDWRAQRTDMKTLFMRGSPEAALKAALEAK